MKTICYVCTSLNQFGGKSTHFPTLFRNLTKRGFRVDFVLCSSIEKELKAKLIESGIPEEHLIFIKRFKKWLLIPLLLELNWIFRSNRYDIVHTFQIQSDVFGGLAAKWAGVQNIYSYYESKIMPENISIFKVKLYEIVNTFIKNVFLKTVVVSHGLKWEFIEKKFRSVESLTVVHLGMDILESGRSKRIPFSKMGKNGPVIGTLSRLSHEKALHRLVDAAALVVPKVNNIQFVIYGDGPERPNLEAHVQRLELQQYFYFAKWVEQVFDALSTLDIFVMPSVREGCPIALMEAMGCARPIIASNIEGIRDLVRDGKEGLLVDTSNKVNFAASIMDMIHNPDQAIRMGKAAQDRLITSFSVQNEINQLEYIYNNKS